MANALILHAGRNSAPEQKLAAAIIAQAFNDMSGSQSKVESAASQAENDARSAILFLTARYGDNARWRNELCGYLDLDGDVLAERVRKILDGDIPWPDARTREANESFDRGTKLADRKAERARTLWQDLKKRL